jgi:acetoin utilization deacetylase AcuC-like enzyme
MCLATRHGSYCSRVDRIDVFWHDDALRHDTGVALGDYFDVSLLAEPEPHFECAQRVANMKSVLERGPISGHLRWRPGRHATEAEVGLIHPSEYIGRVRDFCASGGGEFVLGTRAVPATWDAALAAVGSSIQAVDAVLDGDASAAYALVRPPGHHAQPAQADGYCFFSNAAVAAEHARRRGVERIAIVDWDVHHGNGTQACFYDRSDVLTVSLHQDHGSWGPSHPQTGTPLETGHGDGMGFNVNVALPPGTGDLGYLDAFETVAAPIVRRFRPDLLLVAAGQDANEYDPNARMCVSMAGFRALGRAARGLADELCRGRVALIQEGGYAKTYSAFCLHATLEGILGVEEPMLPDPVAFQPDDAGHARAAIDRARGVHAFRWRL